MIDSLIVILIGIGLAIFIAVCYCIYKVTDVGHRIEILADLIEWERERSKLLYDKEK